MDFTVFTLQTNPSAPFFKRGGRVCFLYSDIFRPHLMALLHLMSFLLGRLELLQKPLRYSPTIHMGTRSLHSPFGDSFLSALKLQPNRIPSKIECHTGYKHSHRILSTEHIPPFPFAQRFFQPIHQLPEQQLVYTRKKEIEQSRSRITNFIDFKAFASDAFLQNNLAKKTLPFCL